ncbi:hypothetical protein CASFOL_015353 [Castilleja foliolosa]|uniref:AMP-activated protein kinase glycogen-binding domain-containing protein n=1 Tax=Castilleja foliolosa TaxID=1961234 RepID=A0ABD3DDH9_9LAMI
MECNTISNAVQPCLPRICTKRTEKFQVNMVALTGNKLNWGLNGKSDNQFGRWRVFCTPVSLEEEFSALQSNNSEAREPPPSSEELKALTADAARSKLIKKLSEANQQNRFLKRQLQVKEDDLVNFKTKLAAVEYEIKALVNLAKEIAHYKIPVGSRRINGKYIQSHLLSRLVAVQKKLEDQIKDVDDAQSHEVPLFWHGVAESVQVMGSFDGWSQGEHLSPEYTTGPYATFSTTLMLRPGRYEIKFLVNGEWQLSTQLPIVGEGSMQNNVLIVE